MGSKVADRICAARLAGCVALIVGLFACFALASGVVCDKAYADDAPLTHGALGISADAAVDGVITLGIGQTATIKVSPYQHVQYIGCDKAECPKGCAELVEDCFTVGKGCICKGPSLALRTATVNVESSDAGVAQVSGATADGADLPAADEGDVGAMQDGTVTVTAVAEGAATITVAASGLRDWQDATATYEVVVKPAVITTDSVLLRQAFNEGSVDLYLTSGVEGWANDVIGVTVAPVVDGVVGEPVALSPEQYEFASSERWGDYLSIKRTAEAPVFSVDELDVNPIAIRTRWGGSVTYPQSKSYEVTIEANGHQPTSGRIACYTGSSSTFSIIVDADGDGKTTDDQTVVKTWTADEIKAKSSYLNGSSHCGMADFRTFSGEGVAIEDLLAEAGVEVGYKDYFLLDTTDHYGNEFTYEELFGATRYFMQSIYDDEEVKTLALANASITDDTDKEAATLAMRKLLAAKALEDNVTVRPSLCVGVVESVLSASDLASAALPTAENLVINPLVVQENQFRFIYGLELVQDEHTVTFETGAGSAVRSQVVKSHPMTSTQNTTMKSSYWANSLVVYRNAAPATEPGAEAVALQKPADPKREGYTFGGWYTDESCTSAFDFAGNDGMVDADVTLYAKWTKNEVKPSTSGSKSPAKKPAATSITVNVKNVTAKAVSKAAKRAGATKKSLVKVTLGKKVSKISKGAFKGYGKVKTLVVKTKKLKKSSVKGSLKNSKVKTVQVKVGSKKMNKKYVKQYAKIFKKANSGEKVKVK